MAWYVGSGPCFSEASVLVPRGGLRLHAQGYRRVALTKTTTTTTTTTTTETTNLLLPLYGANATENKTPVPPGPARVRRSV